MFGLFIIMVATTVPLSNVDPAVAQAAALAWGHLARQVAGPEASAAKLAQAIVPVYGISWNRNVITSQVVGGTNEINRVLCLLRNSNLARSEYARLAAFMKRAYSHSSLFPLKWANGMTLRNAIAWKCISPGINCWPRLPNW